MLLNKKEISFLVISVIAVSFAILTFYQSFQEKKIGEDIDVYRLVPSNPHALIVVNKPTLFHRFFLNDTVIRKIFSQELPAVFISLLENKIHLPPCSFSFHDLGVLFYMKASAKDLAIVKDQFLENYFNGYDIQKIEKYGIEFNYYAAPDNQFFGIYYYHGILVGSYSRKLLEEVARRQLLFPAAEPFINELSNKLDVNSPINILFRMDKLQLCLPGISNRDSNSHWVGADLFLSEGNICSFSSLPYQVTLDSLYIPFAETLAKRLEERFTPLIISFEINKEEDVIYFTGCSEIAEPITSPS